ncbi:MAG: proton-translocating NADH-quinone oxidoreductase, chain [Frankiales bacterium]|nr:proton-translocating NADH-quinone oxidoreductase, chain [Frankiales bacterium]
MTDTPWMTILLLVPAVGALLVAMLPKGQDLLAKQVALGVSLLTLVLTAVAVAQFDTRAGAPRFQFEQHQEWIRSLGVTYSLGADGIALVLIALAALLVPVVLLASWDAVEELVDVEGPDAKLTPNKSVKSFFALMLVLESFMIGVFAATDVFLFYVFFEAMLIPMYFLIGMYGGPRRAYAAVKVLLYSLVGGLLMLAAVIGLYVQSGRSTFRWDQLIHQDLDHTTQVWLFLGFFIAFAIKAPLFPFHTWLPDAGAESPTGGAVLLVGVLDKVGTFGFLRYCLPLFPWAAHELAPYVIALSITGIMYGALLALGQKEMKRLVSYTSVAHFGFIGMGCLAFTTQAGTGAVFYMVNHGLSTGALFLVIGFLVDRGKSRLISDYSGVAKVAPVLAAMFFISGLSALALPGLSTFVSEFLVLVGTFTRYKVAAVIATTGIVLAALYILLAYQRTMQGPLGGLGEKVKDLKAREVAAVAPLLVLMLFLGFYPKPVTDIVNPAVKATMQDTGDTDPKPTDVTATGEKG